MIDDENHPEMRMAMRELETGLHRFRGRQIDQSVLADLNDLIARHRSRWRTRGVDFPVLAAMVVPRIGALNLYRADLDVTAIDAKIVMFVREYPGTIPEEVAQAVSWAWPEYYRTRRDETARRARQ